MNQERRKKLREAIRLLKNIQQEYSEAHNLIVEVMDAEQEAFDNMPEGLQQSERGENMSEVIAGMDDMIANFENNDLTEVVSHLEDICDA